MEAITPIAIILSEMGQRLLPPLCYQTAQECWDVSMIDTLSRRGVSQHSLYKHSRLLLHLTPEPFVLLFSCLPSFCVFAVLCYATLTNPLPAGGWRSREV